MIRKTVRLFDVDSDRAVAAGFKFRDETVPVRGMAAGAGDQYERRPVNRPLQLPQLRRIHAGPLMGC